MASTMSAASRHDLMPTSFAPWLAPASAFSNQGHPPGRAPSMASCKALMWPSGQSCVGRSNCHSPWWCSGGSCSMDPAPLGPWPGPWSAYEQEAALTHWQSYVVVSPSAPVSTPLPTAVSLLVPAQLRRYFAFGAVPTPNSIQCEVHRRWVFWHQGWHCRVLQRLWCDHSKHLWWVEGWWLSSYRLGKGRS